MSDIRSIDQRGRSSASDRAVVVGAGIGGLTAALDLAAQGIAVTVVEKALAPGGKMRLAESQGRFIDAGPTVLTMRWVFEDLFAAAGTSLDAHLTLHRAEVLARHAWVDGSRLDLFADPDRSEEAIGRFAGAEDARAFRRFRDEAAQVYACLEGPFIKAARPSLAGLLAGARLRDLWRIQPFATLAGLLARRFGDPRLRQLFGRYATYCGSSPYQSPATLMLVAHVEQEGVWLVEGGMHRLAAALAALAEMRGVAFRYGAEVASVTVANGRAAGVTLIGGERLDAGAVIVNADAAAVAQGQFGPAAAQAVPRAAPAHRSLSAMTWAVTTRANGFPLDRHNVFFASDPRAEFRAIFGEGRMPAEPTVYVCAQDRGAATADHAGPERLLLLINAPPDGDRRTYEPAEVERCRQNTLTLLARSGLTLEPATASVATPTDFNQMFPGTGGALYGRASHGWQASFQRPGCRTKVLGLYLAGGSAHPGPGVPMAALSGRMAASCLIADLVSTSRSRRTAMSGGTSTASATTAGTG
ncbi:MAG TPA: phytoene desaturase family protein [Beijerinckiaceae bacterium]|jgi:1-hydroxycarotenoid 3,4-desaturase